MQIKIGALRWCRILRATLDIKFETAVHVCVYVTGILRWILVLILGSNQSLKRLTWLFYHNISGQMLRSSVKYKLIIG